MGLIESDRFYKEGIHDILYLQSKTKKREASKKALEILKVEDNVSGETNKIMKEIKKLIGIHNKEDNIFYDKLELVENFIKDNKNE